MGGNDLIERLGPNLERIKHDILTLSRRVSPGEAGYTRLSFSEEDITRRPGPFQVGGKGAYHDRIYFTLIKNIVLYDNVWMTITWFRTSRSSKINPENISLSDIHCSSFKIFFVKYRLPFSLIVISSGDSDSEYTSFRALRISFDFLFSKNSLTAIAKTSLLEYWCSLENFSTSLNISFGRDIAVFIPKI